jgi:PRTRC genetic system protein B
MLTFDKLNRQPRRDEPARLLATQAIIFFEAEINDIKRQVLVRHPVEGGKLARGKVICPSSIVKETHGSLKSNDSKGLIENFRDDNILAETSDDIVFYTPKGHKPIWVFSGKYKKFNINIPTLLFRYHKRSKSLCVVMSFCARRPTLDTLVYLLPLPNISNGGDVCTGSMLLPKRWEKNSVSLLASSFFNSKFSHSNYRATGNGIYDSSKKNVDYINSLHKSKGTIQRKDVIKYGTLRDFMKEGR